MASTGRWLLFFSQILIHLIALSIAEFIAGSDYLFHRCIDSSGNYTSDSIYSSNLNTSLSSISSHAKNNPYGFYNSSFGVGNDRANALALCRGDSEPDICASCVKNITRWLREVCPSQKEAIGWYHGYYKDCLLHYSNNIVLHNLSISPDLKMVTPTNVSDMAEFVIRFNEDLRTLLDSLRSRAASGGSLRKFATGNISGPNNSTIYGMVQCTPDLSAQECDSCLDGAARDIPECCNGNIGARVLRPSCIVRYEPVPFYREILADAPAPVPPPSSSPSVNPRVTVKLSSRTIIAIATTIGVSVLLLAIGFCYAVRRRIAKNNAVAEETGSEITTIQSLQFDLGIIEAATNNFSDDNKIGEGGFGMVYKGTLANGQEIAVKRLSKTSEQGALEFKNEVALLVKLQHRHLVRLLGFCLERGEKILIYEYVPNKSLDYFLFDPEKRGQLDWSRRYKMIGGTARGMLYLHEDSQLRIIHRDLKASNILLDSEMSAKVSDFGLAKLFEVDQTHGKTSRIVGTFGYMSPEYAMHGQFSVKSDVFSFGVLVLEIISGKRNSSFYQPEQAVDLLFHAWKLWREGKPLELMDATLNDSYTRNEVIRCIHMGLLCVQEDVDARPTMATVVLMLNSYSVSLPSPKKPPFFLHSIIESRSRKELEPDQSTGKLVALSVDDSSITHVCPR